MFVYTCFCNNYLYMKERIMFGLFHVVCYLVGDHILALHTKCQSKKGGITSDRSDISECKYEFVL